MTQVSTYLVKGMTCEHCVRAVTEELGKLDGVQSVAVDLARGSVEVAAAGALTDEAVRAAVDEAGYELVRPRQEEPR
jgi:copper chaperone